LSKNLAKADPVVEFEGCLHEKVNPVQYPKIHTWTENNPNFCPLLKFTAPPTFQLEPKKVYICKNNV